MYLNVTTQPMPANEAAALTFCGLVLLLCLGWLLHLLGERHKHPWEIALALLFLGLSGAILGISLVSAFL